jgi:hypothetical protein
MNMKKNQTKQSGGKTPDTNKETTMDLPEVKDIPGQEHVRPPKLKEFADVTSSSDDEEGKGILDEEEEDLDASTNVTNEEIELLERSENSTGGEEEQGIVRANLDNKDEDGEPLNEEQDLSGKDLDVPGAEDDDENEELGEEDEENNHYSLGSDKDD